MTNNRRSVYRKQLSHTVFFSSFTFSSTFPSAERYISILFSSISIVVSLVCITPIGFLPILSLFVAMILVPSLLSFFLHEVIP